VLLSIPGIATIPVPSDRASACALAAVNPSSSSSAPVVNQTSEALTAPNTNTHTLARIQHTALAIEPGMRNLGSLRHQLTCATLSI
jgi:hypothetical protein